MANERPGDPAQTPTAELTVLEVEDTPETRALFKDLQSDDDKAVIESLDAEGKPKETEVAPAAPVTTAAPAVPAPTAVAPPTAPAADPAAAATARRLRRFAEDVTLDLDAIDSAKTARAPVIQRPTDFDLTDAEWDGVLARAKKKGDDASSYGEAAAAAISELRAAATAKRAKAKEDEPVLQRRALVEAQEEQARKDFKDYDKVVNASGLLDLIVAQPGQQPKDPALAARVYGSRNVAEAAYAAALAMVARSEGKTLDQAMEERGLLHPVAPAAPVASAKPAEPVKSAEEIARAAAGAVIDKVTKPSAKARGLKQFAPAGTPTIRLTDAMLTRAMEQQPDTFLKWAEQNPDLDRAFMSGELSAVNQ